MQINPLDVPGVAFEIELLNPNPSSRRTKDGPRYWVKFEIDEAAYLSFMNSRESNLRLIGRMAVLGDTDEQPAHDSVNGKKKEKGPKGAYSYMWEYLHPNGGKGGSGFATLPGVREAIEDQRITATEPTWELLHRVFGVGGGTLAETGPDEVLARFPENQRVELFVDRAMKFQEEKERKQ